MVIVMMMRTTCSSLHATIRRTRKSMCASSFPEIVGAIEVAHKPSIDVAAAAAAIADSSLIAHAAERALKSRTGRTVEWMSSKL